MIQVCVVRPKYSSKNSGILGRMVHENKNKQCVQAQNVDPTEDQKGLCFLMTDR